MQPTDDDGRTLDARYTVEADGQYLAVIMESRSGASDSHPPRNPDYNRALLVLLERLGNLGAVLVDTLLDSRRATELRLSVADRRLIQARVDLAAEPDLEALRRRIGTAQSR